MIEPYSIISLLICSLAVYRLALMLSSDVGPYAMFTRLRSLLKREARDHKAIRKSKVHEGIECLRCSSVWVAVPIGAYLFTAEYLPSGLVASIDCFIAIMALSALSILIHRAFPIK